MSIGNRLSRCLERSGDPNQAEEIARETLVQALRSRHTFDLSRPMLPWLAKIAARIHAKERSKRILTVPFDLLDEGKLIAALLPESDPERRILDREGEHLWSLRPRYRRALLYKYVLRLGYAEIGKLEGISHTGVVSLLRRARAAFRSRIEAARGQAQVLLWLPARAVIVRFRARMSRSTQQIAEPIASYSSSVTASAAAVATTGIVVAVMVLAGVITAPPTLMIAQVAKKRISNITFAAPDTPDAAHRVPSSPTNGSEIETGFRAPAQPIALERQHDRRFRAILRGMEASYHPRRMRNYMSMIP